jgi:predicted CXXCH cytochrome family protein
MKKLNFGLMIALLLTGAQVGYSQTIAGTGHDFSSKAWNTSGEICKVCHTPHNGSVAVADAPLWNHSLSAVGSYTMYTSSTLNSVAGQPDGSSKLCLSCHDGTVALENFGTMSSGTNFMTGTQVLGTSLSNDHPVSITYDAALAAADGGLKDPSTASSGIAGGTIAAKMLVGGKMQCSSCHDVHNSSGVAHLLLKSNAASALCLTCHVK